MTLHGNQHKDVSVKILRLVTGDAEVSQGLFENPELSKIFSFYVGV